MYFMLYADEQGNLIDHPGMQMLGRSGNEWIEPEEAEMIPLPRGASLVTLPATYPVGLDERGEISMLEKIPGSDEAKVQAVGALLPQGFTRTLLPAGVREQENVSLPVLGYAAIGFYDEQIYVAAIQCDEHRKWHPDNYNKDELPAMVKAMLQQYPHNRILAQLACCSMEYGCYTAQNIFYQRWEGGIPTMPACNAACIGCISESHGPFDSPQNRLNFRPDVTEIVEVGLKHLENASEGIISFGQGCEGEPSLNALDLSQAINIMRERNDKGIININTNAGYTEGIKLLCDAGLNAMRVTIFSGNEDNYIKYHRPINYRLDDVKKSIRYAAAKGINVSLNLLAFPGITDREEEIESLLHFVRENPVDMIQLRNLNIDPIFVLNRIGGNSPGIGMANYLNILKQEIPDVQIGSYTHGA